MSNIQIAVIVGSLRKDSFNLKLAPPWRNNIYAMYWRTWMFQRPVNPKRLFTPRTGYLTTRAGSGRMWRLDTLNPALDFCFQYIERQAAVAQNLAVEGLDAELRT